MTHAPHAWKSQCEWFFHKGHRIFVKEAGQGPDLLLLHGFPTASWDYHLIWPELIRHFHVLAPDFIGFGFSDKPRRYRYSLHDQADMVELLLRHKGVHRYAILAHDYGDSVAQELMWRTRWRHRQGVKTPALAGVVLLNGGIVPGLHRPRMVQRLMASPLGPLLLPFWNKGTLRRTFRRIFGASRQPDEALITAFWQLITCNNGKRVLPRLIGYMKERIQHRSRWVEVLVHPPCPLMHLNGVEDPIAGGHLADWMARHSPATVVRLEGTGHYPQVEAPQRVLEHVLPVLQGWLREDAAQAGLSATSVR